MELRPQNDSDELIEENSGHTRNEPKHRACGKRHGDLRATVQKFTIYMHRFNNFGHDIRVINFLSSRKSVMRQTC